MTESYVTIVIIIIIMYIVCECEVVRVVDTVDVMTGLLFVTASDGKPDRTNCLFNKAKPPLISIFNVRRYRPNDSSLPSLQGQRRIETVRPGCKSFNAACAICL